nr:uncharacterized protein LOC114924957 [Arachis hypogaea]
MRFATIERFKEVVKDSFIAEGRELKWIKNDKERVRAGCKDEECPFLVHLSYKKTLQYYQVKTYQQEHTCARDLESNASDQHWLSKKIEKRMATQLHMNTREATEFLKEKFSLSPHHKMVYRAVVEAREKIMGNEREQYKRSRDYWFKDECMPLLHLDGCFLKTYYMGWLLAAVAQDANNQFYVVTYGVVREDIGDDAIHGWTFISDQQKGLLSEIKEVMPHAKLHNCVMQMWKNFINRFKDLYIREVV